jgi:hypothetical protein
MCTYKNSRHLDRMTRRSDKCDCCVYEYIYIEKPVGGAAVHRNRQNKYCGTIGREYTSCFVSFFIGRDHISIAPKVAK